VVITSGLLRALRGRGLEQIADVTCSGSKIVTDEFYVGYEPAARATAPVLLPQLEYVTNDAWQLIGCHANSTPLLLEASYGTGMLTVLIIPDNFADLYLLPAPILDRVRRAVCDNLLFYLEGPAKICLFAYDSGTYIVESFLPEPVTVQLVTSETSATLHDLQRDEPIAGERRPPIPRFRDEQLAFSIALPPHSYRVFSTDTERGP
jgi:hypothetical protein